MGSTCSRLVCRDIAEALDEALLIIGDMTAGELMSAGPCMADDDGACHEHLWYPDRVDGPRRACPNVRAGELLAQFPVV